MNLFICWQLAFVLLTKIALCNGDMLNDEAQSRKPTFKILIAAMLHRELPNDERMKFGGKKIQIASGNGIKGNNYGFFGSFNYDFHHPHKPHPTTASPTTTTPPIETTSGIDSRCPPSFSASLCLYPTPCYSNDQCNINEVCCPVGGFQFSCCLQLGATPPQTTASTSHTATTWPPTATTRWPPTATTRWPPTATTWPPTSLSTYTTARSSSIATTTENYYYCPVGIDSSNCFLPNICESSSDDCYPNEICCAQLSGYPLCCSTGR